MTTGATLERLIDRYDTALNGIENTALERVNTALEASYKQLEQKLLKAYQQQAGNLSLLPRERSLLILNEAKDLLSILNTRNATRIQSDFENLIRASNEQGRRMATELTEAIANEKLQSFAAVPLEAVRMQAEGGVKRLSRHTEEFRSQASAIVELGLVQGWGNRKIATALRAQLGITKGKAETIARTETLSAHNAATEASYQRNGIEYGQLISTADDRTCPFCVARNMQVYELGKISIPLHPKCRCYLMPWKPEWAAAGLIDIAWGEKYRADALAQLQSTGRTPNNGVAPFEKAAGLTQPPAPIWKPGDAAPQAAPHASLIAKGRAIAAALGDPSLETLREFRSTLLSSGLPKAQADALAATTGITLEAEERWQRANADRSSPPSLAEVLSQFQQLTGGNFVGLTGLIASGDRAYALPNEGIIDIGGDPQELTLFHEMAHLLEAQNPDVLAAAQSWRASRATGQARSLRAITGNTAYEASEAAVPDEFVTPYVGKVYRNGLTEVVSIGLEHFASVRGMQYLLERDPEHFYLMLGVLDAVRTGGAVSPPKPSSPTQAEPVFSDLFGGGYRELTPVEAELARSQQQRAQEFNRYLERERESIRRRTSGEIDRQLREYYDKEAATLRKRLGIPEPVSTPTTVKANLQIKSYNRRLKPVPIPSDLDGLDEATLSPTQKNALRIARDYQQALIEINEAIERIPGADKTLPTDAYQRLYAKTNQLFDRLTGLVNEAKAAAGKVENATLERYMGSIAKISKENLPGYEIRPITEDLINRAAVRPC